MACVTLQTDRALNVSHICCSVDQVIVIFVERDVRGGYHDDFELICRNMCKALIERWFVPLGLRRHFGALGIEHVQQAVKPLGYP